MQKSSIFCTSLAKSMVDHTQALSLPMCSVSLVPGMTATPSPCQVLRGQVVRRLSTAPALVAVYVCICSACQQACWGCTMIMHVEGPESQGDPWGAH